MWVIFLITGNKGIPAQPIRVDVSNQPSLQRGARLYMNYCSGCHSLRYLRYNQMAEGMGLSDSNGRVDEELLKNNLIFTQASINDPIRIAMPPEDAKQWFGTVPPDLSLITREKGPIWLYTYLNSFYRDKSKPFGTNNLLMPGVLMPNVLEPLFGELILKNKDGHTAYLSLIHQGELSPSQIENFLQDLINFLVYVGEPEQIIRYRLGWYVLLFLSLFLLVALGLKKVYWQNRARF